MTSILEALREIEEQRRRTRTEPVRVTDVPPDPPATTGLLYPLVAGLAVGVIVVGLAVWWIGVGTPADTAVPPPSDDPAAASAAAAGASRAAEIAWLARADAPQARVERDAADRDPSAATPPSRAAAPAEPPTGTPPAGGRAGTVTVESIRFAAAPEQRAVTLRLDGRRVTLRQGERAAGIEVQLILEDGAYLDRGSEVFFAVPGG